MNQKVHGTLCESMEFNKLCFTEIPRYVYNVAAKLFKMDQQVVFCKRKTNNFYVKLLYCTNDESILYEKDTKLELSPEAKAHFRG